MKPNRRSAAAVTAAVLAATLLAGCAASSAADVAADLANAPTVGPTETGLPAPTGTPTATEIVASPSSGPTDADGQNTSYDVDGAVGKQDEEDLLKAVPTQIADAFGAAGGAQAVVDAVKQAVTMSLTDFASDPFLYGDSIDRPTIASVLEPSFGTLFLSWVDERLATWEKCWPKVEAAVAKYGEENWSEWPDKAQQNARDCTEKAISPMRSIFLFGWADNRDELVKNAVDGVILGFDWDTPKIDVIPLKDGSSALKTRLTTRTTIQGVGASDATEITRTGIWVMTPNLDKAAVYPWTVQEILDSEFSTKAVPAPNAATPAPSQVQ